MEAIQKMIIDGDVGNLFYLLTPCDSMLLVSSSGSCRYCFKEGLVDISSGSSMFRCISSFQAFSDGGCVLALRAYMRYCACDVFFVGVSPLASLAVRVHYALVRGTHYPRVPRTKA